MRAPSLYDLQRNAELMPQQPMRDTFAFDQALYNKSSPMPGAWLAPLQLPGIKGFLLPSLLIPVTYYVPNMVCNGAEYGSYAGTVAFDIATTWPGAMVPYVTAQYGGIFNQTITTGHGTSFTLGGWMMVTDVSAYTPFWGRWNDHDGVNKRACMVDETGDGVLRGRVSSDGTLANSKTLTGGTVTSGTWHFIGVRFIPSVSFSIFLDDTVTTTTATPFSTYYGSDTISSGFAQNQSEDAHYGTYLVGRISQMWMSNYGIPDAMLNWLYAVQSPLFGRT